MHTMSIKIQCRLHIYNAVAHHPPYTNTQYTLNNLQRYMKTSFQNTHVKYMYMTTFGAISSHNHGQTKRALAVDG